MELLKKKQKSKPKVAVVKKEVVAKKTFGDWLLSFKKREKVNIEDVKRAYKALA